MYDYAAAMTRFKLVTTSEERDAARGSKYIQSIPGDIFAQAYAWLNDHPGKELLFVGLGCQAEGFRKFCEWKGIRDRVYIVDLICHGSASPAIWRQYAQALEKRYGGKIDCLTFRDKRKGWPTAAVRINKKKIPIKDYMKVYYGCCIQRPSCHVCPFAATERDVDITMGDFWHLKEKIPEFYDPKGTSVLLLHTDRGERLFETVKAVLDCRASDTGECWQYNLEKPTPASEKRGDFWNDFKRFGVDYVMKKYGTSTLNQKIKYRLKMMFRGGGIA